MKRMNKFLKWYVVIFIAYIIHNYGHEVISSKEVCRGQWGTWLGMPNPPCGEFTMRRYRPLKYRDPACFTESNACCTETRKHLNSDSCFDFAYNTTINLKKMKCLNARPLITGSTGHLMCDCGTDFTGVRCEMDKCGNRCKNGATCMPQAKSGICLCRPGFVGDECTIKPKICGESGTCLNGAQCISAQYEKGAYCNCTPAFGGLSCEREAVYCKPGICKNQGSCVNFTEIRWIRCMCPKEYSGNRCEIMNDIVTTMEERKSRSSNDSSMNIAYMSTVVASVILFLVVAHRLIRRKRKRSQSQRIIFGDYEKTRRRRKEPKLLPMGVGTVASRAMKIAPSNESIRCSPHSPEMTINS